LDLEMIFSPRKMTVIEWAERFAGLLPEEALEVHLDHVSTNRRRVRLTLRTARAQAIAQQITSP